MPSLRTALRDAEFECHEIVSNEFAETLDERVEAFARVHGNELRIGEVAA